MPKCLRRHGFRRYIIRVYITRGLTNEELRDVSGGNPIAVVLVGAAVGAGSAYVSGGSGGQIAGAAVMGGVSAGDGASASMATGSSKALYYGYTVGTGIAGAFFAP